MGNMALLWAQNRCLPFKKIDFPTDSKKSARFLPPHLNGFVFL
jgi:hypothetical protein